MTFTTLISADDLAAHLTDTAFLVCDCRFNLADPQAGRRAYLEGHIPGSVYIDLDTVLSGERTGQNGRHPFPGRDAFAAAMAGFGASDTTQIVAYDSSDGIFAARLWAMMRWLGHDAVAVLDGGFAAWVDRGFKTEIQAMAMAQGSLRSRPSLLPLVDFAAVRAASEARSRPIVDARAPDRFRGENETMDKVGGHIPGAVNRAYPQNLAGGRFKAPEQLHAEYAALLGSHQPGDLISQCGSGVTACHNLLAMEIAGLSGAALYPGSWSEWSSRPGSAIATGPD